MELVNTEPDYRQFDHRSDVQIYDYIVHMRKCPCEICKKHADFMQSVLEYRKNKVKNQENAMQIRFTQIQVNNYI